MAAGDLITTTRAKYNLNNMTTTANEDTTLGVLVTAVSEMIKKWCGRDFTSTSYKELHSGSGWQRLFLNQVPIVSVERVNEGLTSLIAIKNTSWPTNIRAYVQISSTALVLNRIASGTLTTNTLLFADADKNTLGELVTAIDAVGNGWDARLIDPNYDTYASADLVAVQGALDCSNSKEIELGIHIEPITDFEVEDKQGVLYRSVGWPNGRRNIRVDYTAGYSAIPEAVQEACAEWVAMLFFQTKRDPGLIQENNAGHFYMDSSYDDPTPPPKLRRILNLYRTFRV